MQARAVSGAVVPNSPTAAADEARAALRRRRELIPSNVGVSYASSAAGPLLLASASGCHLVDTAGRRYLDCVNNVAHVGHSHPAVVQAAVQQLATLNTNTVSRRSALSHALHCTERSQPAKRCLTRTAASVRSFSRSLLS